MYEEKSGVEQSSNGNETCIGAKKNVVTPVYFWITLNIKSNVFSSFPQLKKNILNFLNSSN